MSRAVFVVGILAFAGCLGESQAPATVPQDVAPALQVVVVDLEFRPIPNATVRFAPSGLNLSADAFGRVHVESAGLGRHEVVASAHGFYANHTWLDVENLSEVYEVALPEKPAFLLERHLESTPLKGSCRGLRVPPVRDDAHCTELPTDREGPRNETGVGRNLTFYEAVVMWDGMPSRLALEVRFLDGAHAARFASGADAVKVEGPSPLVLRLNETDLTPEILGQNWTAQQTVMTPSSPDPQAFEVSFLLYVGWASKLAPPERACDLHPIRCDQP